VGSEGCVFVFVFLCSFLFSKTRFWLIPRGVTGKVVQCSSCRMFEVWDAGSVPADFTCRKCTYFQLLQDRVTELELELDELRIIRDAEGGHR